MLNKVILMGRITANPEIRQNSTGSMSCRFTLAVDRGSTNASGEKQSDFIGCTAWNKTAEWMSQYVDKGSMLIVEGRLVSGQYTDKKYPDVTHYTTDVWCDRVSYGESKAAHDLRKQQMSGGFDTGAPAPRGNYQKNNAAASKQPQNQYQSDNSFGNLSDFEEVISDSDLPF
jgi:single-strand DNA-binding protein